MADYRIEGDTERGFTIIVEKQNLYVSIPVKNASGSRGNYSFEGHRNEVSGILGEDVSTTDTRYFLTIDNQGAGFVDVGIPEEFAEKINRKTEKLIENKES